MHKPMLASLIAALPLLGCPEPGSPLTDNDLAVPKVDEDLTTAPQPDLTSAAPTMSFFITSRTGGGDLGGLEGADATCTSLAEAAGVRGKKWAAYLSTYPTNDKPGVDARDRIGKGPWHDQKGRLVAMNLQDLHDQAKLDTVRKETGLDEKGTPINGRGMMPNEHDILTGSTLEGRVSGGNMAAGNNTCRNWTLGMDVNNVTAQVGHFDRVGGGANPMSWNSAHASRGCAAPTLVMTGGAGRFYCFAVQ